MDPRGTARCPVRMNRLLRCLAVRLTVLIAALVAATAAVLAPAGPAGAAVSNPSKLLNLGTGMILNWDAEVTPPPGSGLHLWVRVLHPGIAVVPGFAAPYQLRNPVTGLCLQGY